MKISTRKITLIAVLSALTVVLTAFVNIKFPNGSYIHLGDAAIFTAAILTGPLGGFFAGGVASAIADVLAGAPQWMLATFIAKGLMGTITGFLAYGTKEKSYIKYFLAMLAGSGIMIICYYVAYAFMLYDGDFIKPLFGIWLDFLQVFAGISISFLTLVALKKHIK